MKKMLVYSRGTSGHRAEYNDVIRRELLRAGIEPTFVDRPGAVGWRQPILFAMLDEDLRTYVACALLGLLTRRRVTGLFFRPGECFKRSKLKYLVKYALFRSLKILGAGRAVTIIPFSVEPRFADVAADWAPDPQLWDLAVRPDFTVAAETPLSREIEAAARGRTIVVALGAQNRIKGFDRLCELWTASEVLRRRYLFVVAGKVAAPSKEFADRFQASDGFLRDRFITDEELRSLYHVSDLVWAAYAPDYDQASGIAGRAFQFGRPVLSRRGAYVSRLMRDLGHPLVEIDFDDIDGAVSELVERDIPPALDGDHSALVHSFRAKFTDTILGRPS